MKNKKIFCAIDTKNAEEALNLGKKIKDYIGGIKLGLEFFSANGPEGIKKLSKLNLPIFLDLKFFDIKNTVIKSIESLDGLPINYLSIHILNGKNTLEEAMQKISELSLPFKLLGITIPTSFSKKTLEEVGINNSVNQQVALLAKLAKETKLDGVVCSPNEIKAVKNICHDMEIFTPGIRLDENTKDDQERVASPKYALNSGADFLVIGRPITKGNPVENIKKIINSIN